MTTPREQLMTLMHQALDCDLGQGENSYGGDWYGCFEHETDATDNGNCALAEHIADTLLKAGWQPPTPPPTRPSQQIPYLDN
jgi:hypothetical protein